MAMSPEEIKDAGEATADRPVVSGPVLLLDRYQISPSMPLPSLDTPSAHAYEVSDQRDAGRSLFALICTPGLPPRTHVMMILRNIAPAGFLPLIESGPVDWPVLGQRCMSVVYARPQGGTLREALAPMDSATPTSDARISDHDIGRRVLDPLCRAIQRLAGREIAHRAIRPDNIFFMDSERQNPVLGDSVTAPPGLDQPIVYETIKHAMASPGGRGEGNFSDDLYALGVTLALSILGRDPVADMAPEDIITAKVQIGTYALLCGKERIPMHLIEPLRGLLADSEVERWDVENLTAWIGGNRASPVQRKTPPRSRVPFPFGGHDHVMGRTLAHALTTRPAEAAVQIRAGEVEMWLRRGLSDPDQADAVLAAVESSKSHSGDTLGSDDYLVTKTAIIMDPEAPIRFKRFAFMPEGYGTALAVEFARSGEVQIPAEVIMLALPALWYSSQPEYKPGKNAMERTFLDLQGFLKNNNLGYGIERCLYAVNPSLPCRSPLVFQDYVETIADVLPALNTAATRADSRSRPIDRHTAAFIAAHFNMNIDHLLRAVSSTDEKISSIGLLSLLAMVQAEIVPEKGVLGLSSWVGGLLGPAIRTYHSRTTRRQLEREIPRLVRQGSLPELFDLIENPDKRKLDIDGYREARVQYAAAQVEADEILSEESTRAVKAMESGQQAAAMTSVILTIIVISLYFVLEFY